MFQFWILLKRALLCIMRDQMLTQLRFISHIIIGIAIGLLYDNIGNDAQYSQQNISLFFLTILFLVANHIFTFHLIKSITLVVFCLNADRPHFPDGDERLCPRTHELLVQSEELLYGKDNG